MLVGITGPSGAGKGCVTREFVKRGFAVIDADKVARDVVLPGEPALKALAAEFGGDILLTDGSLNRRRLAEAAFSSQQGTDALNRIMLDEIVRRMTALAGRYNALKQNCLFDAPLLIEAGLDAVCDTNVAVIAPVNVRIDRLMARDGLTEAEIRSRVSRQHGDDYYVSHCEYVIVNDGSISQLEMKAGRVVNSILQRFDALSQ